MTSTSSSPASTALDAGSYLNARPNWRPTLPTRAGVTTGDFRMVDFLTFGRRRSCRPGAVEGFTVDRLDRVYLTEVEPATRLCLKGSARR